jgi:plasmid stabilization system protein ParE
MVRPKTFRVIWDDVALEQLKNYMAFVHKQSPAAPRIINQAILKALKTIAKNPRICVADKLMENNDGSFKVFVIYSYRIMYEIQENAINILRVRHTSQEPLEY